MLTLLVKLIGLAKPDCVQAVRYTLDDTTGVFVGWVTDLQTAQWIAKGNNGLINNGDWLVVCDSLKDVSDLHEWSAQTLSEVRDLNGTVYICIDNQLKIVDIGSET